MEIRLDLHIHTTASLDGCMILEQAISAAKRCGLNGIAVCDHDVLLTGANAQDDFLVIPGIEYSTEYGHLLGLFVTENVSADSFEGICAEIHRQGGIAILAHPFEHSKSARVPEQAASYLDGIEIWNGRANRKNRRANHMAEEYARDRGLRGFAGSDAHVVQEIGNGVVQLEADSLTENVVKYALLSHARRIIGQEGRSCYVAKSQLKKLLRQRFRLRAFLKWLAFAVKCLLEDLCRLGRKTYVVDC